MKLNEKKEKKWTMKPEKKSHFKKNQPKKSLE
jgi:hypothetical protein